MSKIATKGENAYNWYFNKLRNVGGSVGEILFYNNNNNNSNNNDDDDILTWKANCPE